MIDRRVIGVGKRESEVSFSKKIAFTVFCDKGPLFCKKNVFFIRVDRRVIGVEEPESEVRLKKNCLYRFLFPFLKERVIQRSNPGLEILKVCPTKPIRNQRGANQ